MADSTSVMAAAAASTAQSAGAANDGALTESALTYATAATPQASLSSAAASTAPAAASTADVDGALRDVVHIDAALSAVAVVDEITALKVAADHLKAVLGGLSAEADIAMLISLYEHPLDWSTGFVKGFCGELLQMVLAPFKILLGIISWAGQATVCVTLRAALGLAEVTAGDIFGPAWANDSARDACRGYDEFQKSLEQMAALYDQLLDALGAFFKHPLDWTSEVLELLTIAAEYTADVLEADTTLRDQVIAYMADPTKGGTLAGAVAANVAIIVVPGGEEVAALADEAAGISMAARDAEADDQVAKSAAGLENAELPPELAPWIARLQAALRAAKLSMGGITGDRKYQVLRKLQAYSTLARDVILIARERVFTALITLRGQTGSYTAMRNLAADFNAHSRFMYMLELQRQGTTKIKAGEAIIHGATLAEQVLESAHMVDARFFPFFQKPVLDALGWTTSDDMPAVLATAFEHRRSYPNYFKLLSGKDQLPADLKEFSSITKIFMDHIIKVDSGGLQAVKGAVQIGPETKASEIVKAHLDLWQNTKQFNAPGGIATTGVIPTLQDLLAKIPAGN